MAARKTTKRLYLIPVLSKALDILELVQAENQPMTLESVHRQTRISKTTVYRVLKTFVHRGYLSQSPDGLYRQVTREKKLRFGFAGQSAEMPFSNEVTESLKDAAASVGVDLLVLDNRYDAATALKNAEEFVRSKVDLIIEFQVEQEVAPIIADKIAEAFQLSFGVPVVTVRPFNTFGPRQSARAVIPTIISQCLAGKSAILNGSTRVQQVTTRKMQIVPTLSTSPATAIGN